MSDWFFRVSNCVIISGFPFKHSSILFSSSKGLEQSLHDVETKRLWRRQGDYDSSWDDLGTRRHSVQQVSLDFFELVCLQSVLLSSWMSVCPPICLSAHLPICSSVCLFLYLSAYLPVCPSAPLSVCLSICLSFFLSVCLPVCPSARLPVCQSVCQSVCMHVYLSASLLSVCWFALISNVFFKLLINKRILHLN